MQEVCHNEIFLPLLKIFMDLAYHMKWFDITDSVLYDLNEWRNRPLKKCYAFTFVEYMYVSLRNDYEVKECAVYVILGYDLHGHKEILGVWLSES